MTHDPRCPHCGEPAGLYCPRHGAFANPVKGSPNPLESLAKRIQAVADEILPDNQAKLDQMSQLEGWAFELRQLLGRE